MRTKEPVQVICDGCNRNGAGFRALVPAETIQ